jgi:hypothetical protein
MAVMHRMTSGLFAAVLSASENVAIHRKNGPNNTAASSKMSLENVTRETTARWRIRR